MLGTPSISKVVITVLLISLLALSVFTFQRQAACSSPPPTTLTTTSSDSQAAPPLSSAPEKKEEKLDRLKEIFSGICRSQEDRGSSVPTLHLENLKDLGQRGCDPGVEANLNFNPPVKMCVYQPSQDLYISASILHGGVWDTHVVKEVNEVLRDKPKGLFIDCGANIGQNTLMAAALGHNVVAIEPISATTNLLIGSVARNSQLADRIHLFRNGLGYHRMETSSHGPNNNRGGTHLAKRESESGISVIRLVSGFLSSFFFFFFFFFLSWFFVNV